MHEAQRERLRALADSINESARMARATMLLFLFVALYLALTLLSTTDENLLRNGHVAVPHVDAGITVVHSYVIGPLVFLYLHGQALLLLTVIARKVSTFEAALKEVIPDTADDVHARRKECRDWLSGFALVQALQRDPGASNMGRILSWFATDATPLALLFAIDLSFVRYQSSTITLIHHIILFLDLLLVAWFNHRAFNHGQARTPGRIAAWTRRSLASGIMLTLFSAHPPNGDEDRDRIWRDGNSNTISNLLDAGPCRWWGFACRYLDVSAVDNPPRAIAADPARGSSDHAGELRLVRRTLRFAKFRSARLRGVDFREAELQGSDFRSAQLQGAIFQHARLHGADFLHAQLHGANLQDAQLHGASLYGAELYKANLRRTQLQKVSLGGAKLQSANLWEQPRLQGKNLWTAQLQGADLSYANLQGANLSSANLQSTYLEGASMQGANLMDAQMNGTDLNQANLQGANLEGVQLDGANLRGAKLQCSSGKPRTWRLAWMPDLEWEFHPMDYPPLPSLRNGGSLTEHARSYLSKLITPEMAMIPIEWRDNVSLEVHLTEQLMKCPEKLFGGRKPTPEDMVFHTREAWSSRTDIRTEAYLGSWIKWTVEFACTSEHTARGSMRRWNADLLEFADEIPGPARSTVRDALVKARELGKHCPGLHAISDDEWTELLESYGYI
ncbi:MAG: pentapeptide repeat-containing protein [Boseongicola sp. SB0676_bin_33]|nr:pentapeptide repeat-containing protein [Boseongicola sp. SB0676_bin_33]